MTVMVGNAQTFSGPSATLDAPVEGTMAYPAPAPKTVRAVLMGLGKK